MGGILRIGRMGSDVMSLLNQDFYDMSEGAPSPPSGGRGRGPVAWRWGG